MMKHASLCQIEEWLEVLIASYQTSPNANVIQCILYYIDRVIQHEDYQPKAALCLYSAMRKFWHWRMLQFIDYSSDE